MTLSIASTPVPLTIDKDGTIRVGNTRVILELVIEAFNGGQSPEEIVMQYDALKLADVYAVIAYYLNHRDEIDNYVKQQDETAEQIRKKIEAHQGPSAVRERLLARRKSA